MNQKFLLLLATFLIVTGCQSQASSSSISFTPTSFVTESLSSDASSSNSVIFNDYVVYGSDPRHTLEYAYLANRTEASPMVLLLHGGAWIQGDKSLMRPYMETLVQLGYIYVSINYRLISSPAIYLDMLQDIHLAIRYLKLNAPSLNLDIDRMAIVGESAGGHLALLYSYREVSPIPIQFTFTLVPPVDLTDPGFLTVGNPSFQLLLANGLTGTQIEDPAIIDGSHYPEPWVDASPITHMNFALPTWIAYAGKDELIPTTNAIRVSDKAAILALPIELLLFPNSTHNIGLNINDITTLQTHFERYLHSFLNLN
jgi:acetyl esterase/lipase